MKLSPARLALAAVTWCALMWLTIQADTLLAQCGGRAVPDDTLTACVTRVLPRATR